MALPDLDTLDERWRAGGPLAGLISAFGPLPAAPPIEASERYLCLAEHDLLRRFLKGAVYAIRADAADHTDRRTLALLAEEISIRTTGPTGAFWLSATVGFSAKPPGPRSTREGSRRWVA